MSTTTVGLFLRHLALSEEVSRLGTISDRDLLATYESGRGQAAFTELMRRHGPMVLRTCRRILGQGPDAEDAFQATFVLLARQAGQLRGETAGPLSLGGWLHRVAHRTAVNALTGATRRRTRERQAGAMNPPNLDPVTEATWNEVRPILDTELNALPDEARRLLIACYLQEKTHAEAAAELGLPLGSIARRLEKARMLLAERLTRRGLALSVPLLAMLLEESARGAGVPAVLLVYTVEVARRFTEQAAGALSANVARLVKGGLAQMTKGSTHLSIALAGWVSLLGAGLIACQTLKAWPDQKPEDEPPAAERPAQEGKKQARTDHYGDPLPPRALARLGTVRWRHTTGLFLMAFTRDSKGLVTAGTMDPARLWDMASGRMLRQFDDWDERGGIIPFSPHSCIVAGKVRSTGELGLWDTATGRLRRRQGSPAWTNRPLAFSPDGKMLAVVDREKGTLRLGEVDTDKQRWVVQLVEIAEGGAQRSQQLQQLPDNLLFSANGKFLIWSNNGKGGVHVCDAATGKELRRWYDDKHVRNLAAAPDSRLFALCQPVEEKGTAGRCARLWDVETGKVVWEVKAEGEEWSATAAFSPDGKVLAMGCYNGPLRLLDAATGKELRRCDGCQGASTLAFSPDGKTLASGAGWLRAGSLNQTVRLWDVATGREIRRRDDGHRATVASVAFTPDGKTVASSGWDGTIRLWDAVSGEQQRQVSAAGEHFFTAGAASITTALSADGKTITSATWQFKDKRPKGLLKQSIEVRLWDRSSGRELHRWSQEVGSLAPSSVVISPHAKTVACTKNAKSPKGLLHKQVVLWEAATGKELATVPDAAYAAFSPDGKLLATAPEPGPAQRQNNGEGRFFTLWDAATAKELCTIRMPQGYEGCAPQRLLFSPDGRMLATAGNNKDPYTEPSVIHLWPLYPSPQPLSPQGRGARGEGKAAVRVGTPHMLTVKGPPVGRPINHAGFGTWAFSPDGRMLALSSAGGTVQVLETANGKERARFTGHGGDVLTLAFAPDGRCLASGSRDTTVLVWDVTGRLHNGRLRGTLLSAKQLQRYWADLAGDDAERAGRAIWTLAADPAQSVPFLAEQMRTAAAEVKSRLASVPQLIRDLDNDAFAVREKAKAELARLGEAVEPALRQALTKSPSLERRRRLEELLRKLEANRQTPSGEPLRRLRVVEVLEQIGAAEAHAALRALASDAPAASALAHEAQAALERLDRAERR